MPYMQRMRITKDTDLDDNTTWRYKMPSVGKYTAIEMRINCNRYANHADNDTAYPLEACISRVELLKAGAEPVISLTGRQLDAMNYWDLKRPNPRRCRKEAATDNALILFLLGGRGFYDKEYGFDFARLGETFLEYTYDLKEGTAEYFAASDHDISLYGWRWIGPGEPDFMGYFRSRQLSAWTTSAADALKTIEIPVGRPIRRVAVQGKTRATTIGGTVSQLELQISKGEYSPVIIKAPMDWCMAEVVEYGLHNELGGIDYLIAGAETDLPYWFSYYEHVLVQDYGYPGARDINTSFITIPARVHCATSLAGALSFSQKGWGFQKCLRIGFDHEDNLSDLLDTTGMGALDLICTEAAASIDAACFYQDVMPY